MFRPNYLESSENDSQGSMAFPDTARALVGTLEDGIVSIENEVQVEKKQAVKGLVDLALASVARHIFYASF